MPVSPRASSSRASARAPANARRPVRARCRFAAVEAAQGGWRESNPSDRLYSDIKARTGTANPAKAAVARKVVDRLPARSSASRSPSRPSRPRGTDLVPASSSCFLAA